MSIKKKYDAGKNIENLNDDQKDVLSLFIAKVATIYFRMLKEEEGNSKDNCFKQLDLNKKKLSDEIENVKKELQNEELLADYGIVLLKVFESNFSFYCENQAIIKLSIKDFKSILNNKLDVSSDSVKSDNDLRGIWAKNGDINIENFQTLISWMRIIYTSKDERMELFKLLMPLLNDLFANLNKKSVNSPLSMKMLSDHEKVVELILKDFVPGKDPNYFYDDILKLQTSFGIEAFRTIHTYTYERLFDRVDLKEHKNLHEHESHNFGMLLKDWIDGEESKSSVFWDGLKEEEYENTNCISLILLLTLGTDRPFVFYNDFGNEFQFSLKQLFFRNFKCFYVHSQNAYDILWKMLIVYRHDGKLNDKSVATYKETHKLMLEYTLNNCIKKKEDFKRENFYSYIREKKQTAYVYILYMKAFLLRNYSGDYHSDGQLEQPTDETVTKLLEPLAGDFKGIRHYLEHTVDVIIERIEYHHRLNKMMSASNKLVEIYERKLKFWESLKKINENSLQYLSKKIIELNSAFNDRDQEIGFFFEKRVTKDFKVAPNKLKI